MSNPSSPPARSPGQKHRKFHRPLDCVEQSEEEEKEEKKEEYILGVHPLLDRGEIEEAVRMMRMELQKED